MTDEIIIIRGTQHIVATCITCGIIYTMPLPQWVEQRRIGGFHSCQNGHRQGWSTTASETENLRRERDRLAQQVAQRDDAVQAAERARDKAIVSAAKAIAATAKAERAQKRLRDRAQHGVCPECNRQFANMARHMTSKHSPACTVVKLRAG